MSNQMSLAHALFKNGQDEVDMECKLAKDFMSMVVQLRSVVWRENEDKMNADGHSVCAMFEAGLNDPVVLRGQIILYVQCGSIHRNLFLQVAKYYAEAGGQKLQTKSCNF
jgi:hypothetical protein